MKSNGFQSIFARELQEYLDLKVASHFKAESYRSDLLKFDKFCCERGLAEPVFKSDDWDAWIAPKNNESPRTRSRRVNVAKNFLLHLAREGKCKICPVKDVKCRPKPFSPHIYTPEETDRYFKAVDSFRDNDLKNALQFPVLFRIMYCCGTRLLETLRIRKGDIDFENATIVLRETKLGKERMVAFGADLKALLESFADKCLSERGEKSLIFTGKNGGPLSPRTVYNAHRRFLSEAQIPYRGGNHGPRLHDWRHHMTVFSYKQLSEAGMDLYVALPVLSTYLGHASIEATENYLRLTAQVFPDIEEKFGNVLKEITEGDEGDDD